MAQLGFFEGIARDLSGAGKLRLILQPTLTILLGVRYGIRDAKKGKDPFVMRLATHSGHRMEAFKESLHDAALPLCLALILDSILQRITLGYVRLGAAVVVGLLLAWVPFVISRGLTNRVWRHGHRKQVA